MYLFIDPSEREKYHFYTSYDTVSWEEGYFPRAQFSSLLAAVIEAVAAKGETLASLKGIMVLVGKAGFTSDRIAVTTVNMLVLALRIPALTTMNNDPAAAGEALRAAGEPQYIVAKYSALPNVGTKEPYIR